MSTPAQWAELVTTALLGTDRRPLDVADPTTALLREAARHRVLDRLSASPSSTEPATESLTELPTEPTPPQDGPPAPPPADRLLTDLLRTPDATLVSCWLRACAAHRCHVAPLHWTPLARLAARTSAYDRVALGAAFGPRGRWFLRQNPEWRKLAADAEPPTDVHELEPAADPHVLSVEEALSVEEVLADPERLLSRPPPWRPELVSAAYAVLGGEGPAPPPRSFATRLGVALPPALYPSIAQAGEYYLLAPDASPGRRRTVRDRFVALELAAYARAAIDHAFDPSTETGSGFTRAEIPHV